MGKPYASFAHVYVPGQGDLPTRLMPGDRLAFDEHLNRFEISRDIDGRRMKLFFGSQHTIPDGKSLLDTTFQIMIPNRSFFVPAAAARLMAIATGLELEEMDYNFKPIRDFLFVKPSCQLFKHGKGTRLRIGDRVFTDSIHGTTFFFRGMHLLASRQRGKRRPPGFAFRFPGLTHPDIHHLIQIATGLDLVGESPADYPNLDRLQAAVR